ncbi:FAD-binding oxidoreductase [Actinomycetospora termitidis]|uniref:FAD-binding oxidoreductase n=1 Tax=Actinomycetospora termitidis TaxID=3053470 RepID=A0ABT7MHP9_9PSEU|nr:FAD-binding oxidoreductase [Actinomycetospora sp. Odt1-22]MDL5159971.1 FAD-binding oxidoreductase [Actinomycetospora sp. Odt1-22]
MTELRSGSTTGTGTVLTPGDAGYDEARTVWNADIDRRPARIACCRSTADVVEAVRSARRDGLEIAVRGGGHSSWGASVCDDGVMVHLGNLDGVRVDPDARRARVGGGATLGAVDRATQAHGLATTLGTNTTTGVGGLTLGGGIGWLARGHGLSIDNLVGAEVVLADGSVVHASDDEHPDLFWGLRGGGGNFGVVTEFEFALHPVGPLVNVGVFFWPLARAEEAYRVGREVLDGLPRDAGGGMIGTHAPPAPFLPEALHFTPGVLLLIAGFSTPEAHAALCEPVRDARPSAEFITPMPYVGLQSMIDEAGAWGRLGYGKGLHLPELSDDALAVVLEYLPRKASPMSVFVMAGLGGAVADVGEDDTAFAGSRSTKLSLAIDAVAPTPDLFAADREWSRSFWEALRPYAAGSYVNWNHEVDDDRIRAAYGDAKYERLRRVKATYDPDNAFHRNVNIPPAV